MSTLDRMRRRASVLRTLYFALLAVGIIGSVVLGVQAGRSINFSTGTALSSTDATVTRSTTIGQGIASMPVVIVTPPLGSGSATASAITATTNQQLPSSPIPAPPFLKQVRSWRERIQ